MGEPNTAMVVVVGRPRMPQANETSARSTINGVKKWARIFAAEVPTQLFPTMDLKRCCLMRKRYDLANGDISNGGHEIECLVLSVVPKGKATHYNR